MTRFVSLEEAARMLGMSPEQLVEARDRNEIHGYRDGASWKFKVEEVERFRKERAGATDEPLEAGSDLLGEDDEDLVLIQDQPSDMVPQSPSTVIGSSSAKPSDDSDIRLASSDPLLEMDSGSLGGTPSPGGGTESDVRLVVNGESSDVKVAPSSSSALVAGSPSPASSDLDVELAKAGSTGTGELAGGSDELALDTDALSLSDEEELMLAASGTGSDVSLGSDTGINLATPSDSGISLDEEPLDLGAVSSLELPEDEEAPVVSDEAPLVGEEDFQLEPAGPSGVDEDEASGSQVIDLVPDEAGLGLVEEESVALETAPTVAPVETYAPAPTPGPTYSLVNVLFLFCTVAVLALCGLLMVDVTRNMWTWNEQTDRSSASMVMEMLLNALKLQR
ncbi:MAG: hypothetical protein KatS3mg110_3255 [Pirellulaceae bacterium]|nr:MAG: hypothetical protein KatS3mg110_3255 [Pirellulaceae bacterium]